jgi:co-chaperonin GroES (HSP10)
MKAIKNKLIIKVEDEQTTKSGIILISRDPYKKPTREGIVTSIGEKVTIDVKVGDHVICTNNYGHDIKDTITGDHFIVLEEEFVLAVIENE